MRALLSAYDRTGLIEFARVLSAAGVELVSTGGTLGALEAGGLHVRQVSDVTGFPEILDGRVKTLHPAIHGGILARPDVPSHLEQLQEQGIGAFDIVVNNLYPFVRTVSEKDATLQDALENIDIGGPAMTRAAAKNFPHVLVVVDPADYPWVGEMVANGGMGLEDRRRLAAKAFQHVAAYDTAIAGYLRSGLGEAEFPAELTASWALLKTLRYGENPHQRGALYSAPGLGGGLAHATQLHGIDMSYVNYVDADAAWSAANSFERHAVSVVKHANPCGLAVSDGQPEAFRRAFAGDPVSAYGGIVGFNSPVSADTAEAMRGILLDVIVAPGYEDGAIEMLKKRKRTRVLRVAPGPAHELLARPVSGGMLMQTPGDLGENPASWQVVSERDPTAGELADLAFAWVACRLIKSNAIVLTKDQALIGMGAGQPNRVASVDLAIRVAGDRVDGTVLASDAYFPFPDGVERAGAAGITAVAQPGGSIRDEEVIAAADRKDIAMVFTGTRHFLH